MTTLQLAWAGATATALGILLLAYARPFSIEKLGAFGLEVKLQRPYESPGYPIAKPFGLLLFLAGLAITGLTAYRTAFVATWPTSFSELKTAELQASEIDDFLTVTVNDQRVLRAEYGQTPPWTDFKSHLRAGPNKIEVIIENGAAGGCGGTVALRLNGLENSGFRWTWGQPENQYPNIVCFAQVRTLNLP